VDAVKHMSPSELEVLYSYVNDTFIYQEVIDLGFEAISYDEYTHLGALSEFKYGMELAKVFRHGSLSRFVPLLRILVSILNFFSFLALSETFFFLFLFLFPLSFFSFLFFPFLFFPFLSFPFLFPFF